MARVRAKAPASFMAQVNDTEKRLNILFDHLNNETLVKPDTIQELVQISQYVQARDFNRAAQMVTEMTTTKLETEGGNWLVS